MSAKPKIESGGFRHVKRLVRDGQVVALLLQLSNDRWSVYDGDERRLFPGSFETPTKARDAFVEFEARQSASEPSASE